MKSLNTVISTILTIGAACVWGHTASPISGNAVDQQKLTDAASKGFQMQASANNPQVSVDAVLLPARVCSRVFGKEVSDNYVAIELNISNRNHDAAFLLHSIYIDYQAWLLSGSARAMSLYGPTANEGGAAEARDQTPAESAQTGPVAATTNPNQVASVEYRVVRGEALDAQMWTSRNWTMRTLQLLGVIATGSEFAFKEQNITKAIGAFTGQVVPAANVFWPDGTTSQLDRISDFGFRTNKVFPKESADIVVAFFPIDRFITPGLKKIFLNSPAVFFVPAAAFADNKVKPEVKKMLTDLLGVSDLKGLLNSPAAKKLLDGISLNQVRVSVRGTMALDPDTIAARIDTVTMDGSPDWSKAGTVTGVIEGTLLTNGQPAITENLSLNPQAVASKSTDTELHFSLTVPAAGIPACTVLHFHVTKSKDSKTTDSNQVQFTVPGANGEACDATAAPAAKKQ